MGGGICRPSERIIPLTHLLRKGDRAKNLNCLGGGQNNHEGHIFLRECGATKIKPRGEGGRWWGGDPRIRGKARAKDPYFSNRCAWTEVTIKEKPGTRQRKVRETTPSAPEECLYFRRRIGRKVRALGVQSPLQWYRFSKSDR